jgi:hypothetical protein
MKSNFRSPDVQFGWREQPRHVALRTVVHVKHRKVSRPFKAAMRKRQPSVRTESAGKCAHFVPLLQRRNEEQ